MFAAFDQVYAAALSLLPPQMNTKEAKALLLTIALQESGFEHRRQIRGPARGFWQFEMLGGVRGVLTHPASKTFIIPVLNALCYEPSPDVCHAAIEHNDILACVFARLLLWTLPAPLPAKGEVDEAWNQYIEAWRPGKPRQETWDAFYERAWQETEGETV